MKLSQFGTDLFDRFQRSKEVFLEEFYLETYGEEIVYCFVFDGGYLIKVDNIDTKAYYNSEDIETIYQDMLILLEDLKQQNHAYKN